MKKMITLLAATTLLSGSVIAEKGDYQTLFNGKDLDGWVVKINKSPLNENPGNIFRVEDGLLTVSYDAYEKFDLEFGHIHTAKSYKNYRFRCEYRFIGEQTPGAPGWALANSGIMLHCPNPAEMGVDQKFPNSAEFQLLGAAPGAKPRFTGSLFTPGCMVTYNGEDVKKSITSTIPALPFGEWVKAEAVVIDGHIQHWINGQLVMEYDNPRFDDGTPMTEGHISLQAESHPCQFRNIQILELD